MENCIKMINKKTYAFSLFLLLSLVIVPLFQLPVSASETDGSLIIRKFYTTDAEYRYDTQPPIKSEFKSCEVIAVVFYIDSIEVGQTFHFRATVEIKAPNGELVFSKSSEDTVKVIRTTIFTTPEGEERVHGVLEREEGDITLTYYGGCGYAWAWWEVPSDAEIDEYEVTLEIKDQSAARWWGPLSKKTSFMVTHIGPCNGDGNGDGNGDNGGGEILLPPWFNIGIIMVVMIAITASIRWAFGKNQTPLHHDVGLLEFPKDKMGPNPLDAQCQEVEREIREVKREIARERQDTGFIPDYQFQRDNVLEDLQSDYEDVIDGLMKELAKKKDPYISEEKYKEQQKAIQEKISHYQKIHPTKMANARRKFAEMISDEKKKLEEQTPARIEILKQRLETLIWWRNSVCHPSKLPKSVEFTLRVTLERVARKEKPEQAFMKDKFSFDRKIKLEIPKDEDEN